MIEGDDMAVGRLATYATERNLRLGRCLGSGIHGVVHEAESNAFPGFVAVKAHRHSAPYERERDAYRCLRMAQVQQIRGLNVPQLIAWNDELLMVEITIVQPPFVLDYGGAWLDAEAPEFPPEVCEDWNRKLDKEFEVRADDVRRVLAVLRTYGVVMLDVLLGIFDSEVTAQRTMSVETRRPPLICGRCAKLEHHLRTEACTDEKFLPL